MLSTVAAIAATAAACRCVPPDPCWDSVPWSTLNVSVGGRLLRTQDPFAVCLEDMNSAACATALNSSDNEFWVSDQPAGYLHTGQFNLWSLNNSLSSYIVAAQTEEDIQAGVAFASQYNLRLVVKNTGHDWYARSTAAGSLVIWTHQRASIAWNASFVPDGCSGGGDAGPFDAVIIDSGVQFAQLYAAAQEAGKLVIGGTCDSVGAAGCWLGGCYGTWSKMFGSGAANMLQARVVLANGTLVVANKCQNADLFWSLRGGGGGVAGVVTEFVARTHTPPATVLLGGGTFTTHDPVAYQALLEAALPVAAAFQSPVWGGGVGFTRELGSGAFQVGFWPKGYEVAPAVGAALLQPLVEFVQAAPAGTYTYSTYWSVWNSSSYVPGGSLPWIETHPDREISSALLASYSRYPTLTQLSTPAGVAAMAAAIVNMSLQAPNTTAGIQPSVDFEKGQAGASAAALHLFDETAQNPVVKDALGLLLIMYNVPSLPTLPMTAAVLAALWPRLQQYTVLSASDPLWSVCAAGAAGNDTAAAACQAQWLADRVPLVQAQLAAMNATLWAAFPNVDGDGGTVSGGYLHETAAMEPDWQRAYWGDNYARLLAVKAAYDPQGLFYCHHCVGSEFWTPDGNCRVSL